MVEVYQERVSPIKWSLQKVFRGIEVNFISTEYSRPVFYDKPTLYYGLVRETHINTIEEYTPIPFNLFQILKFIQKENKRLGRESYLLKPLSKEVFERLRRIYPHRYKGKWEERIKYEGVLYNYPDSLLNQMEGFPIPSYLGYNIWKDKIMQLTEERKFEEAIFLLNHLSMGEVDDDFEKLDDELETRYRTEFNINSDEASYNVLLVDDFFLLHIYQFSLIERFEAKYDENGKSCPAIHFDFECNPERAIEKLEEKSYDLILLDIDFGQQKKDAQNVAERARENGIPIVMFSKFERADEYDDFWNKWKSLPRIKKDWNYEKIFWELLGRLREAGEIVRLQQDLREAGQIQKRYVPKEIPVVEGLDIWKTYRPCYEVSGDYYDIINLDQFGILLLVIADVMGKGVKASQLMPIVHNVLHIPCYQDRFNLQRTVQDLSWLVNEVTKSKYSITLFLAELMKESLTIRYINAGHHYPFIVRRNGTILELDIGGLALGYMPNNKPYEIGKILLKERDVLCLYTDGITEAKNAKEEFFGINRLQEIVKDQRKNTAKEIVEEIIQRVEDFSCLQEQEDDITLVVVRVKSED